MKTVQWGIIGCGDVTEKKSGPAFNKIADSKLVAVMRRDRDKAADYAKRHNVPKFYDKADDLINDPDINAVYIATPPSSHKEYTLKVAAAGKHVYVEKPMALNYADCLEMIAACEKAKVKLFAAYYRRSLPNYIIVKNLLGIGAIGEVRTVNIQLYWVPHMAIQKNNLPWRLKPEESGGGLFYDVAPHQLDILDFYFGPVNINSVHGLTANQGGLYTAEDIVTAHFTFDSGVIGSGTWSFAIDGNGRKDFFEIMGSKGRIEFSTFDTVPIRLFSDGKLQELSYTMPEHIQQPFIQTIVDELLGRGKCPGTGVSAARTNLVMDRIYGR